MKNLFNYLVVCLFLFSCKKDPGMNTNQLQTQGKKFPLTFNVADFAPEVVGSNKGNSIAEVPLAGVVGQFTYIAYDSQGKEVSRIKQGSSGNGFRITQELNENGLETRTIDPQPFGCIKDTLAPGQYTIVIIATNAGISIDTRSEDTYGYNFLDLSQAWFQYNRGLDSYSRAEDTFFKKFSVKVGENNSSHKVLLDRIVAKAEFHILDSKPGTVVIFNFRNENDSYRFSDETPFGDVGDVDFDNERNIVQGKTNLSFSKFLINTETPVDIEINVYNQNTSYYPIASKTVKGVRFYKNKRTILTGNIYLEPSAGTGFTVTVNDEFDPDSIKVSF